MGTTLTLYHSDKATFGCAIYAQVRCGASRDFLPPAAIEHWSDSVEAARLGRSLGDVIGTKSRV